MTDIIDTFKKKTTYKTSYFCSWKSDTVYFPTILVKLTTWDVFNHLLRFDVNLNRITSIQVIKINSRFHFFLSSERLNVLSRFIKFHIYR